MSNELALIPQESLTAMSKRLAALSGGRMETTPYFDVIQQTMPTFYSRYMLRTGFDETALDAILADAAAHGGPAFVCYTNEVNGTEWAAALEGRGLFKMTEQAGMFTELAAYTPQKSDAPIICIGADRLTEWALVCEESFQKPSELAAMEYFIRDEACRFYAYMEDDKIIGTLLGYAEDGNYGIHEVSTLPAYRCRGVCAALVHHALSEAKASGNRYASLQASLKGAPVYAGCGFLTVSAMPTWILPL